jgi:hypothetical protein
MADEAEAYINRMTATPQIPDWILKKQSLDIYADGVRKIAQNEGYQKGRASARSELLMKMCEWLSKDVPDVNPCWIAHVAVEDFKCGCSLESNYDSVMRTYTCEKWNNSTGQQQVELFKNVYGYDYMIYLAKLKQEQAKLDAQRLRDEIERVRQQKEEFKSHLQELGVDERLLP